MSEIHPLGVSSVDPKLIEAVGPSFVLAGLLDAQKKTWAVFNQIKNGLRIGMTEIEGQQLAFELFSKAGVTKHWHRPQIRFGAGTALTYYDALRSDYKLASNDIVHFDLGPVWVDPNTGVEYEGDVGDTFLMGNNPEGAKLIQFTHELFQEGVRFWKEKAPTGETLYVHLQEVTRGRGYQLIEKIDGHRIGDYPHIKFTKQRLSEYRYVPKETLWILEFQILHPTLPMGAFYEDILS